MKPFQPLLCLIAIGGLALLGGCAQKPFVGPIMCPAVAVIDQRQEDLGYSYSAIAPGSGWTGENPVAQDYYLKTLVFISAAIRTGQNGPFVACDYEGPEELEYAFLRMSRRFVTLPRPVPPNWDNNAFCKPGSGSVADCRFDSL